MKFILLIVINLVAFSIFGCGVSLCYKHFFKEYLDRRHADKRPLIKYLIDFRTKIKVGDLVKSSAPNFNIKEAMIVLEENVDGPDFSGIIGPGYIVLYNNRKTFVSKRDCYLVTITN